MKKLRHLFIVSLVSLVALATMPLFVAPAAAARTTSCKVDTSFRDKVIYCTGEITVSITVAYGDITILLLEELASTIDGYRRHDICKANKSSKECYDLIIIAVQNVLISHNIVWKMICVENYYCGW